MNNKKKLEINGKSYLLTFGLKFLELLNEKYAINTPDGIPLNLGLARAYTDFEVGNPVVIRDMIVFATVTNVNRPSEEEIEEWLYSQLDDEETSNKLFQDFFEYLKLAPGAKRFLANVEVERGKQTVTKSNKKK